MRFFRRIKLLPGITLNISKSGLSVSAGTRGARVTFGKDGQRGTLGIPGTGLSQTWFRRYEKRPASLAEQVGLASPEKQDDIPCNWYIGDLIRFYQQLPQKHPLWRIWGVGVAVLFILILLLTLGKGVAIIAYVALYVAPVVLIAGLINPVLVRQTNRIAAVWVPLMYWSISLFFLLIAGLALDF